jgi:hypothetical protein
VIALALASWALSDRVARAGPNQVADVSACPGRGLRDADHEPQVQLTLAGQNPGGREGARGDDRKTDPRGGDAEIRIT